LFYRTIAVVGVTTVTAAIVTNKIAAWQAGQVAHAKIERLIQDKLAFLIRDGRLLLTFANYLKLVIELRSLTTLKSLQTFLIKLTSLTNI
jgi:hypothetical protein